MTVRQEFLLHDIKRMCNDAVRASLAPGQEATVLDAAPWRPRGGSPSSIWRIEVEVRHASRPSQSQVFIWKQTTAREVYVATLAASLVPGLTLQPICSHLDESGGPWDLTSWMLTPFREGLAGQEARVAAADNTERLCGLAARLAQLHMLSESDLPGARNLLPRFDMPAFTDSIYTCVETLAASRMGRDLVPDHCPQLLSQAWVGPLEALARGPYVLTHSDASWGNVLLTDSEALLLDWGLSRWFAAGLDLVMWLDPLAPEIAARAHAVYLEARGGGLSSEALPAETARCRLFSALVRLQGHMGVVGDQRDVLLRLLRATADALAAVQAVGS